MIQCKDCEFCQIDEKGRKIFKCDPFSNVKEPECIQKWQLMRLDLLLATYQSMVKMQSKMAPIQDKMIKYMERELNDIDEAEKWKMDYEEPEDEDII